MLGGFKIEFLHYVQECKFYYAQYLDTEEDWNVLTSFSQQQNLLFEFKPEFVTAFQYFKVEIKVSLKKDGNKGTSHGINELEIYRAPPTLFQQPYSDGNQLQKKIMPKSCFSIKISFKIHFLS